MRASEANYVNVRMQSFLSAGKSLRFTLFKRDEDPEGRDTICQTNLAQSV